MASLSPAWPPIVLPGQCAPFGMPLFRPMIDGSRSLLIAGGPLGLHIFQIFSRRRLWYSIPAKVWISGFDVQANTLYVQDGPVLAGWDLNIGGCFAAVNLVDGREYAPVFESGPDASAVMSRMPPVPDWIFELPDDVAPLQRELMRARRVAGWAALLEEEDRLLSEGLDKNPRVPASGIGPELRSWLGSTAADMNRPDPAVIVAARDALEKAEIAAGEVYFSAPVVREEQLQGEVAGQVFVIAQNGRLHALDTTLSQVGSAKFPAPARPELTIVERQNATGSYNCELHYVTADGDIQVINGSVNPPVSLHGWPSTEAPQRDRLLPLRYVGDKLFGGGIFGADFFAMTMDRSAEPLVTMKGNGWKDYDVAAADQQVLLTEGSASQQISFAPVVRHRERLAHTPASQPRSYSLFWSGTGADRPAPLLSIEVDGGPSAPPGFRVHLANTIDTEDPAFTTTSFPPAPVVLESDSITVGRLGSPGGLPSIAWIRCRPAIAQNMMLCVARSTTIDDYLFSIVEDGPDGMPWEKIRRAVDDATAAGGKFPEALGEIPLPPMPGRDGLVAFALASRLASYDAAIKAGQARYADAAQPVRIELSLVIVAANRGGNSSPPRVPANVAVKISAPDVTPVTHITDGSGRITLDNSHAGYTAEADLNDRFWSGLSPRRPPYIEITTQPVTLRPGINQMTVYFRDDRFYDSAA